MEETEEPQGCYKIPFLRMRQADYVRHSFILKKYLCVYVYTGVCIHVCVCTWRPGNPFWYHSSGVGHLVFYRAGVTFQPWPRCKEVPGKYLCADTITSTYRTVGKNACCTSHKDLIQNLQHLCESLGGLARMHVSPKL